MVISVPAYFNDDRRCAAKSAGKLAGLVVERLINEPSAVAQKHHMNAEETDNFIVFDFGGGTLDVSLVEAFDNMVEIKAVAGDNHLGGSSKMPIIRQYIKSLPDVPVVVDAPPDESVAVGAGICAAIKERKGEVREFFDIAWNPYLMNHLVCWEYILKRSPYDKLHAICHFIFPARLPVSRV